MVTSPASRPTIGSLFSGTGALDMAVEAIFGANLAWVSDIDAWDRRGHRVGRAPLILAHRYPHAPNLGDVTAIDWATVTRPDIITGGSPCFAADTPVLTARGYIPIQHVETSDLVLTHENRWRTVTATMNRLADHTVEFAPGFYATPEHRFWTRPAGRVWDNEHRRYRRVLAAPEWTEIDAARGMFLAQPIAVPPYESEAPSLPDGLTYWHLGRWCADGHIAKAGQPCISIGKQKYAAAQAKFDTKLWRVVEERTAYKIHYRSASIGHWVTEHFGNHANGKTLPAWLLAVPEEDRRAFLEGYWSGDGYRFSSRSMRSASVSPCLTIGIRTLAESLNYTTNLHYNRVSPTKMIEGRVVNQQNWWSVTATPNDGRYTDTIGDHRWSKLRKSPAPAGPARVYDLTVDEDHSFIAAGYIVHNCQDISSAGRRAGMTAGTRSNLWVSMREAIAVLQPALVIWENVHAATSAKADSDVEPCPGCVGDLTAGPALRALGRVCGDLATLGFDAAWHSLRASDAVGACHRRRRVFVVAAHPDRCDGLERWLTTAGETKSRGTHGAAPRRRRAPLALLPTPTAHDSKTTSPSQKARRSPGLDAINDLLPTPAANLASAGPDYARAGRNASGGHDLLTAVALLPTPTATTFASNKSPSPGAARRPSLHSIGDLLPTPRAADGHATPGSPGANRHVEAGMGSLGEVLGHPDLLPTPTTNPATGNGHARHLAAEVRAFGRYAPAVARWADIIGSPPPPPTKPGRGGAPRLNPALVEWMMGLPPGWVTRVPHLSDRHALHALGNGVMPQQAAVAIRICLQHLLTHWKDQP